MFCDDSCAATGRSSRAVDVGLGPGSARGLSRGRSDLGPGSPPAGAPDGRDVPSRRLQGATWGGCCATVLADLPAGVRVHVHECRATRLTDDRPAQLVISTVARPCVSTPSSSPPGTSMPPRPTPSSTSPPGRRRGLRYCRGTRPRQRPVGHRTGRPVIVRGRAAFVDLVVLLFEAGAGAEPGRTKPRYVPSGRGPVLHRIAAGFALPREGRVRCAAAA